MCHPPDPSRSRSPEVSACGREEQKQETIYQRFRYNLGQPLTEPGSELSFPLGRQLVSNVLKTHNSEGTLAGRTTWVEAYASYRKVA